MFVVLVGLCKINELLGAVKADLDDTEEGILIADS